jgi:hypothetical protein
MLAVAHRSLIHRRTEPWLPVSKVPGSGGQRVAQGM